MYKEALAGGAKETAKIAQKIITLSIATAWLYVLQQDHEDAVQKYENLTRKVLGAGRIWSEIQRNYIVQQNSRLKGLVQRIAFVSEIKGLPSQELFDDLDGWWNFGFHSIDTRVYPQLALLMYLKIEILVLKVRYCRKIIDEC